MTNTQEQAPSAPPEEAEHTGPFDGLKDAAKGLGKTVLDFGFHKASGFGDRVNSKLSSFAEGKKPGEDDDAPGPLANAAGKAVEAKVEGENPATAAIKGALGGVKNKLTGKGKGGKGGKNKFVNIVEWIDVGVPVRVAYNQWTEFERWSSFMKKLENAQRNEDQGKVAFKAQVFLSHRSWESTIVEMVPDDHIVWQSTGQKGYLNGGITFHEVAPRLTKMCVVVEYHPQGVVEKTLQIWRSVGRAVRRELKRYVRQVQTSTILDQDGVEGWRAEIRDQKIVRTHDEVVEQEQREQEEQEQREAEEAQAAEDAKNAESEEGSDTEAPVDETDTEAEPGIDEDEADAAEDATYLDEAGVGQQDEAAEDEEPVDEESTDEGAEDEFDEEPEDSDDTEADDEGAEDEYDEEEPEDSEDESDEEPEDSADEDEEPADEADDEYESDDDAEGDAEDEYEDEDEESEGEGADDEYEDEESEGGDAEDEYEDEDEATEGEDESDAEGSADEDGEQADDSTPTPKDVASGPVRPSESRRPRRTPQRA